MANNSQVRPQDNSSNPSNNNSINKSNNFYKPNLKINTNKNSPTKQSTKVTEYLRQEEHDYNTTESSKLDQLKSTFRKSNANPPPSKAEPKAKETSHNPDYDKPVYTDKGDLQPLSNPQAVFKGLVKELGQEDWTKKFQAMNKLRQIIRFSPDLITGKNIQTYTKEILKGVDNLRSGISRISLMTLAELSE